MRTKMARIGSWTASAVTTLGKQGPLACVRYVIKGFYNHRLTFLAALYSFQALFDRAPRKSVKALWLYLHSASYREHQQRALRAKLLFRENPAMAEAVLDLLQRRHATSSRGQGKSPSPFRVVFITTIGEALSARYQVDNLCEQLRKEGVQADILYPFEIPEHLQEALQSDILVFQRLLRSPDVNQLIDQAHKRGAALVFEIDDYLFDASVILSHPSVKHASPERIAQVAAYSAGLREMLQTCDYFIGTTHTLAQAAAGLGRTSFTIRNGLGDHQVALAEAALKRRERLKASGVIRVGYQPGTPTHDQDFAVALPALIRLLEAFPQVQLILQGLLEVPEALQPFQERIERWPFVSWEKLLEVTAQFDVAIAPLEVDHPSNKAKSALKYFEAGLVEVPVVASPTEDFRKAIHHGRNGFLANTEEEWYESLRALIRDSSLRRQVGIAARQDVLAHYTSAAQSANTLAVFQTILRRQTLRRDGQELKASLLWELMADERHNNRTESVGRVIKEAREDPSREGDGSTLPA